MELLEDELPEAAVEAVDDSEGGGLCEELVAGAPDPLDFGLDDRHEPFVAEANGLGLFFGGLVDGFSGEKQVEKLESVGDVEELDGHVGVVADEAAPNMAELAEVWDVEAVLGVGDGKHGVQTPVDHFLGVDADLEVMEQPLDGGVWGCLDGVDGLLVLPMSPPLNFRDDKTDEETDCHDGEDAEEGLSQLPGVGVSGVVVGVSGIRGAEEGGLGLGDLLDGCLKGRKGQN